MLHATDSPKCDVENDDSSSAVVHWPTMTVALVLTSAAQQIGASALVLLLLRTLHWGPDLLSSLWALVGTSLFLVPLLGAISDAAASSSCSDASEAASDDHSEGCGVAVTERGEEGLPVTGSAVFQAATPRVVSGGEVRSSYLLIRRRESLLWAAAFVASGGFLCVWYSAKLYATAAASLEPTPSLDPSARRLWSFPLLVVAVMGLTIAQTLQSVVMNGWLVDASSCSNSVAGLHCPEETQSWAMTRRSTGSLIGAVLETVLFGLNVVSQPSTMMMLCVVLQFLVAVLVLLRGSARAFGRRSLADKKHNVVARSVLEVVASTFSSLATLRLQTGKMVSKSLRFAKHVGAVIVTRLSLLRPAVVDLPLVHAHEASSGVSIDECRKHPSNIFIARAGVLLVPIAVVFLLSSTPSPAAAYYAFLAQTLHYPNWILALNGSVGLLAALLSVNAFRASYEDPAACRHSAQHGVTAVFPESLRRSAPLVFDWALRRAIILSGVVASFGILSNLILIHGQSFLGDTGTKMYMLLDEAVVAFAGRWAYMPLLVIGARVAALSSDCASPPPTAAAAGAPHDDNAARYEDDRRRRSPGSSGFTRNNTHKDDTRRCSPRSSGNTRDDVSPVAVHSSAFTFELFVMVSSAGGICGNYLTMLLIRWMQTPAEVPIGAGDLSLRKDLSSDELTALILTCALLKLFVVGCVVVMLRLFPV
jgi:hypothetical protein